MMKIRREKFPFLSLFSILAVVVVLLDQLLKILILYFEPVWNLKIIIIHLITNTGAGFGILQGKTLLLAMVSLVVALLVVFFYRKIPQEKWVQICMGLFLGGIIGNFIDRFFRGYVVDFIDFKFWPAFNIADMMITISAIGLVVYIWRNE